MLKQCIIKDIITAASALINTGAEPKVKPPMIPSDLYEAFGYSAISRVHTGSCRTAHVDLTVVKKTRIYYNNN